MPRVRRCHAPAPCSVACPADVDVPAFVAAIADGDPERGRRGDLRREPARRHVRARVPDRALCEGACVLLHEGRSRSRSAGCSATRPTRRRRRRTLRRRAAGDGLPGRGDRRGACRPRLRGRARRAGPRGHGLRRAAGAGRARPLRDRAVPSEEPTPARGSRARRANWASASCSVAGSTARGCSRIDGDERRRRARQSAWAPTRRRS